MDFEGIGRIAANTTLAACAAGLSAMFYAYPKTKTWDVSFTVNGFLAGLVAVTCLCYWVTGSSILGAIAGLIVMVASRCPGSAPHRRSSAPSRYMASAGSGARCRWGCSRAASTAPRGPLAADNSAPLTGLFYGGGFTVPTAQIIGSAAVVTATFVTSLAMFYAINAFGVLRVSREGELQGLDLHEHGIPAYPEYSLHGSAAPQGTPAFTRQAFGEARVGMSPTLAKS